MMESLVVVIKCLEVVVFTDSDDVNSLIVVVSGENEPFVQLTETFLPKTKSMNEFIARHSINKVNEVSCICDDQQKA